MAMSAYRASGCTSGSLLSLTASQTCCAECRISAWIFIAGTDMRPTPQRRETRRRAVTAVAHARALHVEVNGMGERKRRSERAERERCGCGHSGSVAR